MAEQILCIAMIIFLACSMLSLLGSATGNRFDRIVGLLGFFSFVVVALFGSFYFDTPEYRYQEIIECREVMADPVSYMKEPFLPFIPQD